MKLVGDGVGDGEDKSHQSGAHPRPQGPGETRGPIGQDSEGGVAQQVGRLLGEVINQGAGSDIPLGLRREQEDDAHPRRHQQPRDEGTAKPYRHGNPAASVSPRYAASNR